jgi:FO synthase
VGKDGRGRAELALRAGVDDLGGTLMNESITRAAGGAHGQEMTVDRLHEIAAGAGRRLWQRTTLYHPSASPDDARVATTSQTWLAEAGGAALAGHLR